MDATGMLFALTAGSSGWLTRDRVSRIDFLVGKTRLESVSDNNFRLHPAQALGLPFILTLIDGPASVQTEA